MPKIDAKELGQKMLDAVKDYVTRALASRDDAIQRQAALTERQGELIEALERRVAQLEARENPPQIRAVR